MNGKFVQRQLTYPFWQSDLQVFWKTA